MQRSIETGSDRKGCGAASPWHGSSDIEGHQMHEYAALQSTALSPEQCLHARIALGLSRTRLASLAGLTGNTLIRFEKGGAFKEETARKLRTALEAAGVELISENGGAARVRLRGKASAG